MTRITEEILDELYNRLNGLDLETGEELQDDLRELSEYLQEQIDWRSVSVCGGQDTTDGDICRMIVHGVDAYTALLDSEEMRDVLPRLDSFVKAAKDLLWFVGKNM